MATKPVFNTITLGRRGENLARTVEISKPEWVEKYGVGTFQLLAERNGDETPYPAAITQNGGTVIWPITSADTAVEGYGACELVYLVGDVKVVSEIWMTRVLPALGDASEDPPEPYAAWVDSVLRAATGVEAAVSHYPYINPTNNHWMVWSVDDGEFVDTGVAADGGGGGGGVTVHNQLSGRDAADAHPMSAITGLVSALAGKQPTGSYATAAALAALELVVGGKYEKPSSGIPATDLAAGVRASLTLADSALQEHQSLAGYATEAWVGEQGYLTEHQDISGKEDKGKVTVSGNQHAIGTASMVIVYDDDTPTEMLTVLTEVV